MKRIVGWERSLLEVLALIESTPFSWGEADCMTRVADVALAITGEDVMADHRGYKSEEEALQRLHDLGFSDVGEALASRFPETPPSTARRGDCGIVQRDGQYAAVVVLGPLAMGVHPRGVFRVPITQVVRAFKVG